MSLINVIQNDKSGSSRGVVSSVGATVIKAKRGGGVPVKFNAKESKRIIEYFGIPDVGNESVDDILTYNDSYPIWVSAPSSGGLHGGVLAGAAGSKSFLGGKSSTSLDFTKIENVESFDEVADGNITNFTKTLTNSTSYVNQSVDLKINGVLVECTASDLEVEIVECSLGSGTYTRATGVFDFTFTVAPVIGVKIEALFLTDESSSYFSIINKNPQADDLAVKISRVEEDFVLNLYKKSGTKYTMVGGFPKTFSTTPNKKDGFGTNIYGPVLFKNSDYIEVVVNDLATVSTFTDDTTQVDFAGGVRGATGVPELTAGWDHFKQVNKYAADIFFDTTAESSIPPIFSTLRNSYQKYSYYILPVANESYSDAIASAAGTIEDNKGLAYYWGWAKVLNAYTGSLMTSSLMGRRALRLADMHDVFNGLAPAWFNENGTHGGQLGSGVVEMFFDADENAQELLYQARLNPTIMHSAFGVVNTRERTSQSMLSDYASIGHVRLADYLIKNIVGQALPYQLYKLNDYSHRISVKSKIDNIIAPTASEPFSLLRDYIVKCDEENNDDAVLAREEFVVNIAIKFTPFSKYINVFFTNSAQGTNVEEDV